MGIRHWNCEEVPMNEVAQLSRHRMAMLVWLSVLPTLTVLQLLLGGPLRAVPTGLRMPIMATLAVPLVIYVVQPQLQRLHARLVKAAAGPLADQE